VRTGDESLHRHSHGRPHKQGQQTGTFENEEIPATIRLLRACVRMYATKIATEIATEILTLPRLALGILEVDARCISWTGPGPAGGRGPGSLLLCRALSEIESSNVGFSWLSSRAEGFPGLTRARSVQIRLLVSPMWQALCSNGSRALGRRFGLGTRGRSFLISWASGIPGLSSSM
jgi:hypothetical protein